MEFIFVAIVVVGAIVRYYIKATMKDAEAGRPYVVVEDDSQTQYQELPQKIVAHRIENPRVEEKSEEVMEVVKQRDVKKEKFDARRAIIYSEILKPKFKEF